jgi:hypothetical protein
VGESGGNQKSATFLSPTAVRAPRFRHFWRFSNVQKHFSNVQKHFSNVQKHFSNVQKHFSNVQKRVLDAWNHFSDGHFGIPSGGNVTSTTWNMRFCAENRVSATFCEFHHFFRHFPTPPPSILSMQRVGFM